MVSASNMNLPDHEGGTYGKDRPTTVLLMPAFQFVDGVTPGHVGELIGSVINTAPTNTSALPPSSSPSNKDDLANGTHTSIPSLSPSHLPAGLSLRNSPHKYIILMCSQATRDARCGQSAPPPPQGTRTPPPPLRPLPRSRRRAARWRGDLLHQPCRWA